MSSDKCDRQIGEVLNEADRALCQLDTKQDPRVLPDRATKHDTQAERESDEQVDRGGVDVTHDLRV